MRKNKIVSLVFIGIYWYLFLPFSPQANALNMKSDSYQVQMGDLNMLSGRSTSDAYRMTMTGGQLGPGLYSGDNYKVRAGFQYIMSIIPFAFSIDVLTIDFGVLSPTTAVTRTNNLTISVGSAGGYQVTALENHPLRVPASGADIPDTTCDDGSCTQTTSAAWTNPLVYGFGYRCDNVSGTDCASGFATSTYYKQFADDSLAESPVAAMSGANVGRNKKVQITYKVNISGTQPAGLYSNVLTYVATPTF